FQRFPIPGGLFWGVTDLFINRLLDEPMIFAFNYREMINRFGCKDLRKWRSICHGSSSPLRNHNLGSKRRVCVPHQFERHVGEPLPGRRVLDAANRIERPARPPIALAVRLAGNLHPQIGIEQWLAGVGGWPVAQAAVGRVAPVLRVACRVARYAPRTLAVSAAI